MRAREIAKAALRGAPAVAVIGILATGTAAWAAEQGNLPASMLPLLRDPEHQQTVMQAAQRSLVWVNNPCPGATFANSGDVAIFAPVTVDAQGTATGGAWRERIVAKGCGKQRLLNVLTVVEAPGKLASAALLPGTTRADPQLQRDAMQYAVVAAGGPPPPSCKKAYVGDTKYIAAEGPVDRSLPPQFRTAPWREEWTMVACETTAVVTLHFAPDASGTNIRVNLGETRRLP